MRLYLQLTFSFSSSVKQKDMALLNICYTRPKCCAAEDILMLMMLRDADRSQ